MENAVSALKMAAAVLIFIVAITSSFSLFGTAKRTADSIILMEDKQAYLDAAELDNGILYTSTTAISGTNSELDEDEKAEESIITGITKNGDRIVGIDDIISTIYRYHKENYSVTVIKKEGSIGKVIARFDTALESYMADYNNWNKDDFFEKYRNKIKDNLELESGYYSSIKFYDDDKIEDLYKVDTQGYNNNTKYGAPWLGDDEEILKRIIADLYGTEYENKELHQKYEGKNLINKFKNSQIIEITNEIDENKYLKYEEDGKEIKTDLVQEEQMPTIEIIYIIV